MADTATKSVMSLVATSSSRIRDLVIKDGQLIFIQDIGRIAFDFKGKRVFYNQIVELETEADRLVLEQPLDGYYFVIDTACLWMYKNGWIQITDKPKEILFVGVEFPQLGQANKLYVDITEGAESISVWSEEIGAYVTVSNMTYSMTKEDVIALFN